MGSKARKIVKVIASPIVSHTMPKPLLAGIILAATVSGAFLALGVRSTTIPFHTISWGQGLGHQGGVTSPENIVVNDQAAWSNLWTQLCNPAYCPPPPEVNFTSRTVLAALLGQEPTGGYTVNITRVSQNGPNILVQLLTITPGPSCVVGAVITSPAHIVDIPKTEATVHFTRETTVISC